MKITVRSGDTISEIAYDYGTTEKKIVDLNKAKYPSLAENRDLICAGWELVVSGSAATADPPAPASMKKPVLTDLKPLSGTPETLFAQWNWDRASDTDHYEVIWYRSWDKQGIALQEEQDVTTKYATYSVPSEVVNSPSGHVSVVVRAVAKTTTVNNKETPKFATTDWATKKVYYFRDNPPNVPPTPSATIDGDKMIITVNGLDELVTGTDSLEFEIVKNNSSKETVGPVAIRFSSVTYTHNVASGCDYKVRCRAVKSDGQKSDWSAYSSDVGTAPAASGGITTIRATSSTSVYLAWKAASKADTYELEYATKREYLNSSDQVSSVSSIQTTNYTKTGLESGQEYFFRVRAVNSNGESAWSKVKSIILGKKPSPPTTWSSTTTAIVGEPLKLYWVHNSEDGSKQVNAQLELTVNGTVTTHTIQAPETSDEEPEETSVYDFNTSGYVEGTTLKWRVKTRGITNEYSDWSVQREIDIYARPTLMLLVRDMSNVQITSLTSFPFKVIGEAGPNTQTPIGYHLSIIADESYETIDRVGDTTLVSKGSEVYSRFFDINTDLDVTLSASDMDLANNINYTVNCIVTMDSGLTAEESVSLTVAWNETVWPPNAEIAYREDSYSAMINPYCVDAYNDLVSGVTLSVYRNEFDGAFKEIASGLVNTRSTYVIDPHPALDTARYRIVARDESTGAINYMDVMAASTIEPAVIIQWDEEWSEFEVSEYGVDERQAWSGSLLKLPYNIDSTFQTAPDIVLVEYIGRQHPVGYYGTQIGEIVSTKVLIPKDDRETIYQLRRLQRYMGNVYYREPSGVGFWASIKVSFGTTHLATTVPVSLEITRVEGGV